MFHSTDYKIQKLVSSIVLRKGTATSEPGAVAGPRAKWTIEFDEQMSVSMTSPSGLIIVREIQYCVAVAKLLTGKADSVVPLELSCSTTRVSQRNDETNLALTGKAVKSVLEASNM